MPTTPNMILVLPIEDDSDGIWDSLLSNALTLVDMHDHTTGAGVPVPTAGLGIDADVPFAGFAAAGLKAVDFNAVTAITSGYLTSLFVNTSNDELYWRTAAGVNVQVTSGSSLNASLLGGFTGDYGSGDEEANYSAGSSIYNFLKDDSPQTRAFIDSSDIRLFEASGGVTNAVKLKSPAALAASYTVTFPAAVPAGLRAVQMNSSGTLSASNTFTAAVTVDAPLTATGLITASAGLTAAANQHVTVSGTGVFKHGTVTTVIPAATGSGATTGTSFIANGLTGAVSGVFDATWAIPIVLPVGARILTLALVVDDSAGNALTARAWKATHSVGGAGFGGTTTALAAAAVSDQSGNVQSLSLFSGTEVIASANSYCVAVDLTTGTGSTVIGALVMTWDQP